MKTKFNFPYILGISFISALGGYLFGFDFAVITGGLPFLTDQFELNATWQGLTTASLAAGAFIGCSFTGHIVDQLGRKPGLLIAAGTFAISSIVMGLAPNLTIFIGGRIFAGIGVGMASMLSPMYIAEISPGEYRGRMVALNQLTIVIGIVITHLVNFYLKDIGITAWRWMFGLGAVPSVCFLIGVFYLPESPRWLAGKHRVREAENILKKIGDAGFASSTITKIQETTKDIKSVKLADLFHKKYFPVLLVGIVLAVFQQWCGINVVFNYTAIIFEKIGADRSEQLLQALYIGIANLVFTLIAFPLVDKIGRKPLMLFGSGGLAVLYIVVAFILKQENSDMLSLFLIASIATYAISLAPVTWVLISEIFPNKIRGKAVSVSTMALWLAYLILVATFPILSEKTGEHVPFIVYAIICVLGFLFISLKLKETKGKTLEEMENEFVKLT